jgi:ubiquinone/menaquinone biosynthesis C-methylase UbiE/N-acetylglutamate synthase-like GNAT family acetyltransferase/pyruvate-formate lyase-activating enzyme
MDLEISMAIDSHKKSVEGILEKCNLLTTGLDQHFHNFHLAKLPGGIAGCIGIEIYGRYGIIRSTAVLPQYRKKSIGWKLAERMIDFAKDQGVVELYLKTENEAAFFKQVGFSHIFPEQIPAEIKDAEMLAVTCCGPKAATMAMNLEGKPLEAEKNVINQVVEDKYAALARAFASSPASSSCCGTDSSKKSRSAVTGDLYESLPEDIPAEALAASLGCGNPTLLAQISPGEVVLDLGSGGGLDVFLSAKKTGPSGKVYGLDMTDEMLELARENQRKAGVENVEFLKGHIEDIPLPANSIDLIISNCVVNLSTDKDKVLGEAYRVLKPGGRFAISDIVFLKKIPAVLKKNMEAWSGCIAGALERNQYISKLEKAGFENIRIEITRTYQLKDFEKYPGFRELTGNERKELEDSMTASFVKASKPKAKKKKTSKQNQNQVALISTYETGFQPLIVSTAAASLLQNGITPDVYDLYLDRSDKTGIQNHEFFGIGLTLFDSLQGGVAIAEEIREKNPGAHICFYGPYADLNKDRLLRYGDSCILGDWERPIARLTQAVLSGNGKDWTQVDQVYSLANRSAKAAFDRDCCVVPARHLFSPIYTYTNTFIEYIMGRKMVAGNVETTRGCHHKCKFCSVYATSGTKMKFTDPAVIMADVDQLVKAGVEHITFVDAEFFNNIKFSLDIVHQIHDKYPRLTYDFTTRIDHVVENEAAIPEFKQTGCIAITTSIEFPREDILKKLEKGINLEHILKGMEILKQNEIKVHTTFVTFNPWVDLEGLMNLSHFIKTNHLEDVIDPIQYETRLHLYKGSPLLKDKTLSGITIHEQDFHYEWEHPDPRVDEIFKRMVRPVEEGEFKRCCLRC